jgi:formate hydrogenlyase subunit 4
MGWIALLVLIISAVIFPGIIGLTKAKLSGRKGAGILQPIYDIIRLLKKGSVYSTTTSIIFQIAPLVYLASIMVALLFVPFGGYPGLISFNGDFIFFAYVLATGRFMMIISALDTGSGFEGMGANREALYSMIAEPAFFILIGSLALITDHTSFNDLFNHLHFGSYLTYLVSGLGIYLLAQFTMIENSRLPVDDPKTHLELTMVHEVMVLDNSGIDLAFIQIGNALKFAIFGGLIANLLIPTSWSVSGHSAGFILVEIAFAIAIGFMESFRARHKMARNPQWILSLTAFAIITFLTVLIITHKFILN